MFEVIENIKDDLNDLGCDIRAEVLENLFLQILPINGLKACLPTAKEMVKASFI